MDIYQNFAALKEKEVEGVDFRVCVVQRASTVIVAPHGGGIEPGTSELAKEIAKDHLSLAIFEGTKSAGNGRLHITSTNFDEPQCLELVQASNYVVAIHGEASDNPVVYLGGKDDPLGAHIRSALEDDFAVERHENPNLQGLADENICNRGRRNMGVQLELSRGLRETFFESLTSQGRNSPTEKLSKFANAIRKGLLAAGAL